jgi:MoxR-like ATPase
MTAFDAIGTSQQMHVRDLTEAMQAVQSVHVSDVFIRDCVELVNLTRSSKDIELGCSPRAALALVQASRARAFIHGRSYVIPEDFFALAEDVILHRMRLTYEALATGKTATNILEDLLRMLA